MKILKVSAKVRWRKLISERGTKFIHENGETRDCNFDYLWEEVLERFHLVNKNTEPGLDICEGNKLIMSLKDFVNNLRHQSDQKLKEYEEKASVGIDYNDINKRRITPKFSDRSTDCKRWCGPLHHDATNSYQCKFVTDRGFAKWITVRPRKAYAVSHLGPLSLQRGTYASAELIWRPATRTRLVTSPTAPHHVIRVRVRPSVILRELDRIVHRHRPAITYSATEEFLRSDVSKTFEDESRRIRADTAALLQRARSVVPRAASMAPLETVYSFSHLTAEVFGPRALRASPE
ncbi:hypothetical protein EVAR_87625_1 [Eumeta japonica]|uniref:Uncharacterized protein n=1 Tax=Eumeta variegata TaxID=151549 RepID=A0A4C1WI22_EUMVA|nr:hypothetical protein EVAR_87625_1 [Eumeta japonica]